MATMDMGTRPRDTLPSISHLDLDQMKSERLDPAKYYLMNGLSISTAPLSSPTTTHSGPPPPYSCAPSTAGSASGLSGYISPPESTTRRSTRDEKESPGIRKSLPSIHEALGDKSMSFPAPLAASSHAQPQPVPTTAVGLPFPEAPRGPVNPFSQPTGPPPVLKDVFASTYKSSSSQSEMQSTKPSFSPTSITDPRQPVSQHFGYPGSPRSHPATTFRSSSLTSTSFNTHNDHPPPRSPQPLEPPRSAHAFTQFSNGHPSNYTTPPEPFQFSGGTRPEDHRAPYTRPANEAPYGDTVKRHLDLFDAEVELNEISEASARTLDFARHWGGRYQAGNRSGYFPDALALPEIDEMLRQSHRIFENLSHLREVVIAHQTAMSEQRARLARGNHLEEDYHSLSDDYKGNGFSGNDAKKRRGKAAPPGRCHSCNRAETPEWRRGPDGARTLCNACGLHYAKLTRKIGVNKAAALTGSNLRPKNLDSTRP